MIDVGESMPFAVVANVVTFKGKVALPNPQNAPVFVLFEKKRTRKTTTTTNKHTRAISQAKTKQNKQTSKSRYNQGRKQQQDKKTRRKHKENKENTNKQTDRPAGQSDEGAVKLTVSHNLPTQKCKQNKNQAAINY